MVQRKSTSKQKAGRQIRKTSRAPDAVDRSVGETIRVFRTERGLTLQELGTALGISHQQLQKYETGANRVSAGMLYLLAETLRTPVESLFHKGGSSLPPDETDSLSALRKECRFWINRERSSESLKRMSKVLQAISCR